MTGVLFIAYHYPPIAAGAERAKGFVRHLPRFGYRPYVLTTSTYGNDAGTDVYRAGELLGLYRSLFNSGQRTLDSVARPFVRTRAKGIGRFVAYLKQHLLIPDGQIGWLPHALHVALQMIRRHRIKLIFSTAPPYSAHVLGMALQEICGLPWVADFRDTWTFDPLDVRALEGRFRRGIETCLEARVARKARRVIGVSDVACSDFKCRFPDREDRVWCIPNGFEPDDLGTAQGDPRPADAMLRLVYTGSFSRSHALRTPDCFFRALDQKGQVGRICVVLVGALDDRECALAAPLIEKGVLQVTGALPRCEALAWQRRADVLLLVDHPRQGLASNVPGKCYEYLASGKPIFALVPQGATRDLIESLNAGFCAPPDDVEAIGKGLMRLMDAHETSRLSAWRVPPEKLRCFHREEIAKTLARCFGDVLAERRKEKF